MKLLEMRWFSAHCRMAWVYCFCLLGNGAALAQAVERNFELASGDSISYTEWQGQKARVILLPSDEGFKEQDMAFAQGLAAQELQVIYPHLHDSYFISPGTFTLDQVPMQDLLDWLTELDQDDRPLFIIANERVSVIAITLTSLYQQQQGRVPAGLILLSPYLEANAAVLHEQLEWHPAALRSNLPIMLFQPESSSRIHYLQDTLTALQTGGSPVFVKVEPNLRDAYHIWPDNISEYEQAQRDSLPARIAAILPLLESTSAAALPAEPSAASLDRKAKVYALPQALASRPLAPEFALQDLHGELLSRDDLRGKVVLLNFWATWCPPCVEELPALQRLHMRVQDQPIEVVSIDVGESAQQIENFLRTQSIELDYPILVDEHSSTVRPWRITAFPSTYILDQSGHLRYGLMGAIDWDSDEVVELLEGLLSED